MRYRFFRIPVHGGEEERELDQFLSGHRIVAVDRQFVADGSASLWAVCVTYVNGSPPQPKGKIDYREVLDAAQFKTYARLRELRKQLAERDGVPVYALFTNEQIALMVQRGVTSSEALGAIDGVGQAKLAKYGAAFLEVLRETGSQSGATGEE